MNNKTFLIVSSFLLFLNFIPSAQAQSQSEIAELRNIISMMEKRIVTLENKLAHYEQKSAQQEQLRGLYAKPEKPILDREFPIEIRAGITSIIQKANNANGDNLNKALESTTDASYSIDLEFEKAIGDKGLAYLHLETGDGQGVENDLAVFSNVNRDADDSDNAVAVTEAWYEHNAIPQTLLWTVGKIDATSYIDTNEYANDETSQFLARLFRNSPTIEFPDDNSFGARVLYSPTSNTHIDLVAMDANDDWEEIFDNLFVAAQVNFQRNFFDREGQYRFYGWSNQKNHSQWLNTSSTENSNYGFGLSFDQSLCEHWGVFLRYGWQNSEVFFAGDTFSIEDSWTIGTQWISPFKRRPDDILGLAYGQINPSEEYVSANSVTGKDEKQLEMYYNFLFNDHISISPNVIVIWDPLGTDASNGSEEIVILGLRTHINF